MKQKIKEALKTRAKNLGLDDSAFDGVAAFGETIVKEEADIEGFAGSEATMNLLKTYQSVADKARAAAKTKNEPETKPSENGNQNPTENNSEPQGEMAQLIKLMQEQNEQMRKQNEALTARFDAFEADRKAKSTFADAETAFKGNDYVKKYADEATDAWERATEMYEATGKSWTAEQLQEKAMGYFNKAVGKKGVDTTKPFKSDGGGDNKPQTDKFVAALQASGRIAKSETK